MTAEMKRKSTEVWEDNTEENFQKVEQKGKDMKSRTEKLKDAFKNSKKREQRKKREGKWIESFKKIFHNGRILISKCKSVHSVPSTMG